MSQAAIWSCHDFRSLLEDLCLHRLQLIQRPKTHSLLGSNSTHVQPNQQNLKSSFLWLVGKEGRIQESRNWWGRMGQHAAWTPSSRHRRDVFNATGAYCWQTAPCCCHVCHTLTSMSMTYSLFHWHARYMPLNTFLLPSASLLGANYPPCPLFGDKNQKLMKMFGFNMTHDSSGAVSGLIMAQHIRFIFFFPWDPCSY